MSIRIFYIIAFIGCFLTSKTQTVIPDWGPAFLQNEVAKIKVTIPPDSMLLLLSDAYLGNGHEFPATAIYETSSGIEPLGNIGFRTRGNTSLQAGKKSFKIDFANGWGTWNGLHELNLNGSHNDPSMIRAKLCWDALRHFDLPGSRVSMVELYVNEEYKGLYSNVEFIDDAFTDLYYNSPYGNIWKCLYPADLNYLGNDPQLYAALTPWGTPWYELQNNTELNDYSAFSQFVNILNNSSNAAFPCEIKKVFNIDRYIQYLAMDVVTGNWDGGAYNKNNFYLIFNDRTRRLEYLPYDLDNTLGVDWLGVDWSQQNIYNWDGSINLILYNRIMNTNEFRTLYAHYVDTFSQYLISDAFAAHAQSLRDLITPSALADTYRTLDYAFDDADFLNALDSAWGGHVDQGILTYLQARTTSIASQLQVTTWPLGIWEVVSEDNGQEVVLSALSAVDDMAAAYRWEGETAWQSTMMQVVDTLGDAQRWQLTMSIADTNATLEWFPFSLSSGLPSLPCQTWRVHFGLDSLGMMINEVAPSGTSAVDEFGVSEDWVELYKVPGSNFSYNNVWITDNPNQPNKWKLSNIPSNEGNFIRLWADDDEEEGIYHLNFKLSGSGEFVGISYLDYGAWHWLDSLSFPTTVFNQSWGRAVDGAQPWVHFVTTTPDASNQSVGVEESQALTIQAYPNPMSEGFYWTGSSQVQVVDAYGRVVAQRLRVGWNEAQSWSSGVYTIIDTNGHVHRVMKW
jgi:hypothetical protein